MNEVNSQYYSQHSSSSRHLMISSTSSLHASTMLLAAVHRITPDMPPWQPSNTQLSTNLWISSSVNSARHAASEFAVSMMLQMASASFFVSSGQGGVSGVFSWHLGEILYRLNSLIPWLALQSKQEQLHKTFHSVRLLSYLYRHKIIVINLHFDIWQGFLKGAKYQCDLQMPREIMPVLK